MPVTLKSRVLILLALTVLSPVAQAAQSRFENVDRVVAIADIHGAFDAMTATLQKANILDENLAWAGGDAHLVVVGDILDRGPGSRAAMDLLMRLEGEAATAGGMVHVLFGNHESMPMTGDLRYVSAAEYAAFSGEEDPEERAAWLDAYAARNGASADALREQFEQEFPPGYFALRRAFRADGHYGAWLLEKNIIVVINNTAFVHGGLSPLVAKLGLEGVNGTLKNELTEFVKSLDTLSDAKVLLPTDSHYNFEAILRNYMPAIDTNKSVLNAVETGLRLGDTDLLTSRGPLWYRGNIVCQRIVESHRLDAALAAIGAQRVVVGHTPTPNRKVLQRFGGRLIEIDTGMLNTYYNGSGNALVIENNSVEVINQLDVPSVPMQHPRRVGWRTGNLSADQLQELLQHGEVVAVDKHASGKLVKIRNGSHTVSAVFKKQKRRGNYPGVAAYRLDKLLQLDMVTVTVAREIDGVKGSLQFVPERRLSEVDRSADRLGGGASCPINEQWAAMYLFDVLIYNEGRSQQRMHYDSSSWQLMLSEHDRAFSTSKGRPPPLRRVTLPLSDGWRDALRALSDDILEDALGDVLDKRRLRAVGRRRDELLAAQ